MLTDILIYTIAVAIALAITYVCYLTIETPWKHLRIMCTCGHRERGHRTQWSARTAAETHMLKCRGTCIASPLPAADIAKAFEAK